MLYVYRLVLGSEGTDKVRLPAGAMQEGMFYEDLQDNLWIVSRVTICREPMYTHENAVKPNGEYFYYNVFLEKR